MAVILFQKCQDLLNAWHFLANLAVWQHAIIDQKEQRPNLRRKPPANQAGLLIHKKLNLLLDSRQFLNGVCDVKFWCFRISGAI